LKVNAGSGGLLNINTGIITTTGDQRYNKSVVLGNAPVGAATSGAVSLVSTLAGDIHFNRTLDGANALTINTAGGTYFHDAVGQGTPLIRLTTDLDAGLVSTDKVYIQGGRVDTTEAQTYGEAVQMSLATTLTASAVTFDKAVIGASSLEVVGASNLKGSDVTTTGSQIYGGAVTLGANTTLTGVGVRFDDTVQGATSARTLTVEAGTGEVVFTGALGGAIGLIGDVVINSRGITRFSAPVEVGTLTTNLGGAVEIKTASVTTAGAQSYGEAVVLGANTTLTATQVSFANSVNGAYDFSVVGNAVMSGGTVTTTGKAQDYSGTMVLGADTTLTAATVTLGAAVSGAHDFSVVGNTVMNGNTVTTTGKAQSYSGTIDLGANTTLTASSVTFGNAISGAYDLSIVGNTMMNGGTVTTTGKSQNYSGTITLGVDTTLTAATVTLGNAVTGAHDLSVVGNTHINGGTVTTTGKVQNYSGTVTLGANTTLTANNVTFGNAVTGLYDLSVVGNTVMNGSTVTTTGKAQNYSGTIALGADTTLTATTLTLGNAVTGAYDLTVVGNTVMNGGTVTTTGKAQNYSGTIALGADTTLTAATITFGNAVTGAHDLSVVGNTVMNGGTVTTTGKAQSYSGTVTLGTDTALTGAAVTLMGNVSGDHDLSVTGGMTFGGATLNTGTHTQTYANDFGFGQDTTLTASRVYFMAAVDSDHNLNMQAESFLRGGLVNTHAHTQIYAGRVNLDVPTTFTASQITFANEVMGDADLIVVAPSVVAPSVINTFTHSQNYSGAVSRVGSVIFTGKDLTFGSTLDATVDLTIVSTGITRWNGAVGLAAGSTLRDITVNGGGTLEINGGLVKTNRDQTYTNAVLLVSDTHLSAHNLTFDSILSTVNGVDLQVSDQGGLMLGDVYLVGDLTVSTGMGGVTGGISQNAGKTLWVGGTSTLIADTATQQPARLGNDNKFTGALSFVNANAGSWQDVSVKAVDPVVLGQVVTTRAFDLQTNGNVTQAANTTLQIGAAMQVQAGSGAVTLANAGNDFMGAVSITGASAQVVDSVGGLVLGDITTTVGGLTVNSTQGDVTQAANAVISTAANSVSRLTATQTSAANAPTANIALTNASNSLGGTFSAIGNQVSLATTGSLRLDQVQAGNDVVLSAQVAVQTNYIATGANLNVSSAGGTVDLGQTIAINLNVDTAGGNITQSNPLASLNLAGNAVLNAGSGNIVLPNASNTVAGTASMVATNSSMSTSTDLRLGTVVNRGALTLVSLGDIDLGMAFISGGDLTLQSRGNLNLGGADIGGDLHMNSTGGNVSFGSATVTGDLTANTLGGVVDLGTARVGQNLVVETNNGNIIQSSAAGAALTIGGQSRLNAGTGNVTLPNVPNQFAGPITLQAKDVQLAATGGLVLAESTVTGSLAVNAATGNITQTGRLNVAGASAFTATQGDVVLQQTNSFAQPVALDAVNASINSASALTLGASRLTGDLTANVAAGDVTQTAAVNVGGKTAIQAVAGDVTLKNAGNTFANTVSVKTSGALSLTSAGALTLGEVTTVGDTELKSTGKLNLGTSTFAGKFKANSGGFEIVQTGPIKIGGNSDFDAGSAKIDLFDPKNSWSGAILYKGGIVMINHPQLMNAVNAGTLVVRVETSMGTVQPIKVTAPAQAISTNAPAQQSVAKSDGAAVTVAVARPASVGQTGLITVAVSAEAAAPGRSFSFSLEAHVPAANAATTEVRITQMDGKPLPDWLRYEPETKTFVATSVPPGAFPLQLKVGVAGVETMMVINEKP
jgi:hypothetical protein